METIGEDKTRKQRLMESQSHTMDVQVAKKTLIAHLDEFPSKILRTLIHTLNMSVKEPRPTNSVEQFRLEDLMHNEVFDRTYHNLQKVPEYFIMAWFLTKNSGMTGDWWSSFRALYPRDAVVRKMLSATTGLCPDTKLPRGCHVKIVLARLLDQYFNYMNMGRLDKIVEAVKTRTFNWKTQDI